MTGPVGKGTRCASGEPGGEGASKAPERIDGERETRRVEGSAAEKEPACDIASDVCDGRRGRKPPGPLGIGGGPSNADAGR